MGKERNFEEKMAKLSDEELYDVLAHEKDYVPEAIEAAKKEFQNRNLPPERISNSQLVAEEKNKKNDKSRFKNLKRNHLFPVVLLLIVINILIFVKSYNSVPWELEKEKAIIDKNLEISQKELKKYIQLLKESKTLDTHYKDRLIKQYENLLSQGDNKRQTKASRMIGYFKYLILSSIVSIISVVYFRKQYFSKS